MTFRLRASEVSAPLSVSNRTLRECLSLETARRRKLIRKIDSPDFSFERHRLNARLNLARAELLAPELAEGHFAPHNARVTPRRLKAQKGSKIKGSVTCKARTKAGLKPYLSSPIASRISCINVVGRLTAVRLEKTVTLFHCGVYLFLGAE
jgi:hypothetical protein